MLKGSRNVLLMIMMLILIVACAKEDKGEIQSLLSDKQSKIEDFELEEKSLSEANSPLASPQVQNNGHETSHQPTSQQKIVYTKLNSWNNDQDYYEISFNTEISELVKLADLKEHIEFSPQTKGRFEKRENKIIRFYPEERFAGDQDYKVKIDQAILLAGDYPKLELSFYNPSPILKMGQVSLVPTDKIDEYYLEFIIHHYRGRYPDSDYHKGIDIRLGKQKVEIDKVTYANSGEMTLISEPFTAFDKDVFTISPHKNIFKYENERVIYYSNSIGEMRKFLLRRTDTITDQQGNARIELTFTKNLDTQQSLQGLISVFNQEEIAIDISKFMNKVVLTGNFELNQEYTVQVKSGIRAADNSFLKETKNQKIKTFNRDRLLEFADQGVFLSSINNNSINIKVVNYPEFEYQLWAIQVENIAEMIHNVNIVNYSKISQPRYYRSGNLHWYGEQIKSGKIKTEVVNDKDSFIKLDLGKVAKADPNKIYILNLTGKVGEVDDDKDDLNIKSNYHYYNYNRKVSKMILFTDYAVSAKAFKDKLLVNVVDVTDGSAIGRAEVELRSYNNLLLASGKTNSKGEVILDKLTRPLESDDFFIIAKRKDSLGFLSSRSMFLDNTKFRVERDYTQKQYKLEAFLDRNLYRPGETVNLMVMVRDKNNQLVKENLPLIASVYDPQSKLSTEKITNYRDGFAKYSIETQENSNTGDWRIEVEYGNQTKYIKFKIEAFVPERINTTLKADQEAYHSDDEYLNLTLTNNYLFGEPLIDANCLINIRFNHNYNFAQSKFSEYSFIDEFSGVDYSMYQQSQELKSDENGIAQTSFKLLGKKESSHPYFINVNATVTEADGRPIERSLLLPASPQNEYIGLSNNRYLKPKSDSFKIPVVVVDDSGDKLMQGSQVEYVVYGQKGSWWWDYDYNYQASYKKSESTTVIDKGVVTIGKDKYITFSPQTNDFHIFIVEAKLLGNEDYQITRKYFNSFWGDDTELTEDNSLELKTDKAEYEIGETVKISIPSSKGSKLFLNVIKQNEIVKQEIIDIKKSGDYVYEFIADAKMTPNVYVDVRVVQGQKAIKNDLPLRLYGIIPVKIINKASRLDIKLDIPDKINSNSKFTGKIDVGVKKKTQYIVSVVDQGLVNRTNYSIPNPWQLFYSNEGYYARDFDNYSFFINAQNREIFRTIMIGGGMYFSDFDEISLKGMANLQEMNRLQETGVQRFKPVSYFLGILETDNKGKGSFEVEVGDYIGALKVTVVAVNEEAFGREIDHTIVKDEIIAMPTLPRVLTPNDQIEIPVSLVISDDISSNTEIELQVNDLLEVTSQAKQIVLQGQNRALVTFSVKVRDNIGKAVFVFNIKSKEFSNQKKIDVGVRLPSAYQTDSKMLSFIGNEINYKVPEVGYSNSSQVYLSFTQGFEFDADQHLRHTIEYPYGGAVMKTAITFNQVLLSDFIKDVNLRNQLDANVNAYFLEIVKYNRQGLYEWPGWWQHTESRTLLNTYALHTFLLAKEKGYNINEFVYNEILYYLKNTKSSNSNLNFEDAYKLYVLALAGQADIAKLNFYNEQNKISISSNAVVMLNMAYQESGFDIKDITKDMKADVTILMNDKSINNLFPNQDSIGALELYYNSIYNKNDERKKAENRATALSLAQKMQSLDYWNFYNKGWNLFALAGYVSTLPKNYQNYSPAQLEVSVAGKTDKINVKDAYVLDLTPYRDKDIKIKALSKNAKDVIVTLYNTYVPKIGETKSFSNNITYSITYTDLNGNIIDASSLEQGQSFIAQVKISPLYGANDIAATFILPSGWEFASDQVEFDHKKSYGITQRPDYVDMRDDRAIIYGKVRSTPYIAHSFKINTVTKGKFMMPASMVEDIYHPENQAMIKGKIIEVK